MTPAGSNIATAIQGKQNSPSALSHRDFMVHYNMAVCIAFNEHKASDGRQWPGLTVYTIHVG
jgi:hypothetical protein